MALFMCLSPLRTPREEESFNSEMDCDENGSVDENVQAKSMHESYGRSTLSVQPNQTDFVFSDKPNEQGEPMPHRKRRCFTDKFTALQRLRDGESRPKICREMHLAESTLRGWIKQHETFRSWTAAQNLQFPGTTSSSSIKESTVEGTIVTNQYIELDKVLYSWFLTEHESGQKISGYQLKIAAERLFFSLNPNKVYFRHRKEFIQKFLKHHNILPVCITCKPHGNSILVPTINWESNVNSAGDSPDNGISIKAVVGNYSEHTSSDKNPDCSSENISSYEINSVTENCKVFADGDESISTEQHLQAEEITKSQLSDKFRNHVPSSSTIVFYLEESQRWFQSQVRCNCSHSTFSTIKIQELIQIAKHKARMEGQKKITDYFTKY